MSCAFSFWVGDPARHAGGNPELVCIIPFYTVRLCFSRLEMAHKRPAATQAAPGQRRAGARLLSWRGTLLIGMQQHKRPAPHSTSGLHTAAQAACAPPHKRPAPCRIYGRQPPRTSGLRTSGPPPRTSGPPPHTRRRAARGRQAPKLAARGRPATESAAPVRPTPKSAARAARALSLQRAGARLLSRRRPDARLLTRRRAGARLDISVGG